MNLCLHILWIPVLGLIFSGKFSGLVYRYDIVNMEHLGDKVGSQLSISDTPCYRGLHYRFGFSFSAVTKIANNQINENR